MERLLAFGRSRLRGQPAAGRPDRGGRAGRARSYAAYSFVAMHARYLMGELGVAATSPLLATALLAPLEVADPASSRSIERIHVDRIVAGWTDLARRITERLITHTLVAAQPEGEPVDQGPPGRLDHVVRRRRR